MSAFHPVATDRRIVSRSQARMPLPFILYSSVQMPRMFASLGTGIQPDMTLFFSIFLSNLVYIVTLIWLIVLLAGPSELAPNSYGATI